MAFFTRVLYKLSLFDSTVVFLAPRASAVGYLLRPLPSLATSWSLPPSRLSPPRISRRLPFEPAPLACHLLVAAAVALVAIAPQLAVTF